MLSFSNLTSYKPSGVEWLGDVPAHWVVRRMKYLLRERDTRSVNGSEQLLRVSQYTGVTRRKRKGGRGDPDTRAKSLVGYKNVESNDLVVNIMLAWNGSMGVSEFRGIASPAYCVYQFRSGAHPWYFHYLLRSSVYKTRIKAASTGVVESRLRLYTDDLYRLYAFLPPFPEQAAIARYLDRADGRIRRYIDAKQKLIGLLEEEKQAIINRAVTRGLPAEAAAQAGLDPNVRLKPSGVKWLGDVPEHWKVLPIKRWIRMNAEVLPEDTDADFEFDYLDIGSIGTGVLVEKPKRIRFATAPSRARRVVKDGDTIVSTVRTYLKAVWHVKNTSGDLVVSTGFAVLAPKRNSLPEFVSHLAQSNLFTDWVTAESLGIAYPAIAESQLGTFHVSSPPFPEQAAIARYLDKTTADIEKAISRARRENELLREYRTRLIADVVTGKLDVREAAAQLPEEEYHSERLDVLEDTVDGEAVIENVEFDGVSDEAEA